MGTGLGSHAVCTCSSIIGRDVWAPIVDLPIRGPHELTAWISVWVCHVDGGFLLEVVPQ